MARRLFTLLSALSLLLCVVACGLWARSCWVAEELRRNAAYLGDHYVTTADEVRSAAGVVRWTRDVSTYPDDGPHAAAARANAAGVRRRRPEWHWSGRTDPAPVGDPADRGPFRDLRWEAGSRVGPLVHERHDERTVTLPWWLVTAAAGVLPAARSAVGVVRRRARPTAAAVAAGPPGGRARPAAGPADWSARRSGARPPSRRPCSSPRRSSGRGATGRRTCWSGRLSGAATGRPRSGRTAGRPAEA